MSSIISSDWLKLWSLHKLVNCCRRHIFHADMDKNRLPNDDEEQVRGARAKDTIDMHIC